MVDYSSILLKEYDGMLCYKIWFIRAQIIFPTEECQAAGAAAFMLLMMAMAICL